MDSMVNLTVLLLHCSYNASRRSSNCILQISFLGAYQSKTNLSPMHTEIVARISIKKNFTNYPEWPRGFICELAVLKPNEMGDE